jgi:hypothetical protein
MKFMQPTYGEYFKTTHPSTNQFSALIEEVDDDEMIHILFQTTIFNLIKKCRN